MIPTPPVQRTDAVTYNVAAAALQKSNISDSTRAPEPTSAQHVTPEAPKNSPIKTAEIVEVDVSLVSEEVSVEFRGVATITPSEDLFIVDLSFAYFDVVIVSSDGGVRQLSTGDHNIAMSLGKSEFAFIFTPGSRSHGSGYLGTVRRITSQLAAIAAKPQPQPPQADNRAVDAMRQAARAQAAARQASTAAKAKAASQAPSPHANLVTTAFASFASLTHVQKAPPAESSGASTKRVNGGKGLMAAAAQAAKNLAAASAPRNKLHIEIDEADIRGTITVVRKLVGDNADARAGRLFDETA